MKVLTFGISDKENFQQQVLFYYQNKKNIIFLNSNTKEQANFLAISDSDKVNEKEWKFGFISYDYKNKLEELLSNNFDGIQFPEKYFFTPELLFKIEENEITVSYHLSNYTDQEIDQIINAIKVVRFTKKNQSRIDVRPRIKKEQYIKNVEKLQNHIQLGDIYEVNYCQEFYAEKVNIAPIDIYLKLNKKSPTPFSCFVKHDDKYLLSASPERFIQKLGSKIISQPIKGTIKRGETKEEDQKLKEQLYLDKKERNENIMIVDLVRNDMSKIAKKKTVNVDELCAIYTYPQVHQMVSTISANLKEEASFKDIIHATFPMGSMTGAPKIRAMKLIEEYEVTKRGLYSGTVGYINSVGDFNFSVVIRSILYNSSTNYLSFMVGGAITNQSIPEKEYEECMLKAKAIFEVLKN